MTRIGLWSDDGELAFAAPIAVDRVKPSIGLSLGAHPTACASR